MSTPPTDQPGRDALSEGGWGATGAARLAIGLVQGLLLAWLIHAAGEGVDARPAWPATRPEIYGPLLLVAAYLPPVLLAGVGRLRLATLLAWSVAAGLLLAFLGWSDIARQSVTEVNNPPFLDFPLLPFAAAALFIAHHLIAPADRERRLIAAFPTYFDTAWLAGVQLAMSLGFALAFWLLLNLGGALFGLIGIRLLNDLLREAWVTVPLVCVAFALAVQLTDVRPGLIRGVRTVALMLLSWLLLVITVLVGAFLAALPFTGVEGLTAAGSATALVLAAAGALIILINTAYQDGLPDNRPPAVLRWAARIAAVLLTPLVGIAAWGVAERISQYGLTPDRIIAGACVVVGVVYALGYALAALKPGPWMKPLERTNVLAAVLTVVVIVCLFTPIADPARLSVADQTVRLERGAVTPGRFDYRFLRFESGRAGEAALARLARSSNPEIARRARAMQGEANRYTAAGTGAEVTPALEPYPASAALPDGFRTPVLPGDARADCSAERICVVASQDLNGDGRAEALLATAYRLVLFERTADGWVERGAYVPTQCGRRRPGDDVRVLMRRGAISPAPAAFPDLRFGDGPPVGLDRRCESRNPPDPGAAASEKRAVRP
jgi:hypothetical protein